MRNPLLDHRWHKLSAPLGRASLSLNRRRNEVWNAQGRVGPAGIAGLGREARRRRSRAGCSGPRAGAQRGGRARVVPALRAPLVHREGQEPRRLAASREGLSPTNSLHRRHSRRVHPSTPTDGSPEPRQRESSAESTRRRQGRSSLQPSRCSRRRNRDAGPPHQGRFARDALGANSDCARCR